MKMMFDCIILLVDFIFRLKDTIIFVFLHIYTFVYLYILSFVFCFFAISIYTKRRRRRFDKSSLRQIKKKRDEAQEISIDKYYNKIKSKV